MTRIKNEELVLLPTSHIDPANWNESEYDAFVDELCRTREYQKEAIFTALRYLIGGKYQNLRELAEENYQNNPKLGEAYGSRAAMEKKLQFPDKLSCSLDLATGTGKSYVLYGLAAIMLAKGTVDRVLVLCPSLTIEKGLTQKFRQLAADDSLRTLMPGEYTPKIVNASETVTDGCICVENYHAILKHVNSSIRDSFSGKGERTLVLNDEAHHVATSSTESKQWKKFLQDEKFKFNRIVGVSGTCYIGNDYFTDVVSRYSLRQAIEGRVVKNVEYVTDIDARYMREPDNKWQLIYQKHKKNILQLKRHHIRPLTIVVTGKISHCDDVAEELRAFLQDKEGISKEQAKGKVLVVTSASKHQRDVARLGTVDNPQSKVEWIISVSMLTEGWDVKNVFQIVPHEERAFNSKLLIAQVLGRGLRIPETWKNGQPLVTVFNHDKWSGSIQHLVNEVLDIDKRVSSKSISDSPHHFSLHNLEYETEPETKKYLMKGEYNMFKEGFIDLPTADAKENVTVTYERVSGNAHKEKMTIHHQSFTVAEVAEHMHNHLRAIDRESAKDSKYKTNYGKRFSLESLAVIVRDSVRRASIDPQAIPEEIRQKFLFALNVLKRRESKRVTYSIEAKKLISIDSQDRHAISCSATDLMSGGKAIFCRSDCAIHLPSEQQEFYAELIDKYGDFAGKVTKMDNDFYFKSPVNLAIADHKPEQRFVGKLCEPQIAELIHGWLKNTDMGFYAVEYAWSKERTRRTSHVKHGKFSPDFFIKDARNDCVYVVEIKSDEEINDPPRESIAKYKFASKHFSRLNDWLKKTRKTVRYQFNMLTPQDYEIYFSRLKNEKLSDYNSHLEAEIMKIIRQDNGD